MRAIQTILIALFLSALGGLAQADVLLKDTQGKDVSFDSLKGKWVFINYWAGWCDTCVEEIPEFNRFYERHKKDPVALFAVNYDNLPLFKQNSLIHKLNIQYPNLLTDPGKELRLGDIRGVPVTFIFNPKGELVKTLYGGQTAQSLDDVISTN